MEPGVEFGTQNSPSLPSLPGCLLVVFQLWMCHQDLAHHTSRILVLHLSTVFLNLRRVDCGSFGTGCIGITHAESESDKHTPTARYGS
eukprot:3346479-Amphidinium_carterae.1